MTKYVLGFMFSPDFEQVLLIRKLRPEFQAGHLNGIGGHIEPKELSGEAMIREFEEECGIKTTWEQWTHFCTMQRKDNFICLCYWSIGDISQAKSMTDEQVEVHHLYDFDGELKIPHDVLFNLHWLIPYALDSDSKQPLEITYN